MPAQLATQMSRCLHPAARTTMPGATTPISDLKITGVEAIYLRLPDVKTQCDSGQDALIVKVTTDAGIVGYGEVDSNPMAVEGVHRGAVLAHDGDRAGPRADRRGPVPDRVSLAQDVPGQHLRRPARDRRPRDERDRPGPLGHQGQGTRHADLEAARRRIHEDRCEPTPARSSARRPPRPAAGAAVRRPGVHGRQVRLGPDGPGRRDRRRAGPRGPRRARSRPRPDDRRRAGLTTPRPPSSAPGRSSNTTRSGSRSRSCRTITWAMPSWPRPARCGSPPARRRASGSRSSSSWTWARSTSSRST